jgi:hypothetical protein
MYERARLPDTRKLVRDAEAVLGRAHSLRSAHRRRKRPTRSGDLSWAVEQINIIMRPIKTVVLASAWHPVEDADRIRELSDQLQRERRKLRKMLAVTTQLEEGE